MCEILDIFQDIENVIKEEEKNVTKQEYIESNEDPPIEEFPRYIWLDSNLLLKVRAIIQNEGEKKKKLIKGLYKK
jgi:hypothetical protein